MEITFTRPLLQLLATMAFTFFSGVAQSQDRSAFDVQEWTEGEVVLTSGETMSGALSYHHTEDVVQVRQPDGAISSYSPVNVEYFVAKPFPGGPGQVFRTYPWNLGKDYSDFKKPTFFEQLNEGNLTLIMRESYVQQDMSRTGLRPGYSDVYYNSYPAGSNWVVKVKQQYFVLLPDGEIKQLRNIRKDLQQLCGKKWDQVKAFVKMNRLDFAKHHELVAIVNYYNSLQ